MKPPKDPTKHHYIPEFLLRWWAGPDGRFERYDRPIPSKIMTRRAYPSEAGWFENLYASPGHSLGPQWLETRVFQTIDNLAAPVLRKLNSDPIPALSAEERSAWTVFLRSLSHRTPHYLRSTIASGMAHYQQSVATLRAEYIAWQKDGDPSEFDTYVANLTPEKTRLAALQMLPEIMGNPRVGQFLNSLPTRVITLPKGTRDFLMSDDPMARTNGLKTEHGHIAIPISPRRLFVSTWRPETLQRIVDTPPQQLVANMNRWVVESARYFVAARDRSQDRFIRNRFGVDPKDPILASDEPDLGPSSPGD